MYAFRRMTPEQRDAIVKERRNHDHPLHTPPHKNYGEGWYLISAATYEHRMHFNRPSELTSLELRLLEFLDEYNLPQAGWVVMPNHYHVLVHMESSAAYSPIAKRLHGRAAQYANRRDNKPGRKVWFRYSDRKIRSERHFWTTLHYIVFNPQKHSFVSDFQNWAWSCCPDLIREHGSEWIENLQQDYPLKDYGKGWDEYCFSDG